MHMCLLASPKSLRGKFHRFAKFCSKLNLRTWNFHGDTASSTALQIIKLCGRRSYGLAILLPLKNFVHCTIPQFSLHPSRELASLDVSLVRQLDIFNHSCYFLTHTLSVKYALNQDKNNVYMYIPPNTLIH